MAGFEESDLYAAFGLEQPAGGNEPGAAEPGAQEGQAQGTEPGTGGVQEPELDLAGHEPPAEPGEGEVRGGSGDAGDVSGAAPAEGGQAGAPAQQTAARRRREEQQAAIDAAVKKAVEDERARTKGQMEAFFAKAGMKNTVTGKPARARK